MQQVNIDLIKSEASKNPKVKDALEWLSDRQRGRQDTTIRRFQRVMTNLDPKGWTKAEVTAFMKMLQTAGAGRVVYGSGTPKFMWDFHMRSVACAALDKPEPPRVDKEGNETPLEGVRRQTVKRHIPRLMLLPTKVAEPKIAPKASEQPKTGSHEPKIAQVVKLKAGVVELEIDISTVSQETLQKVISALNGAK